VAYSHRKRLTTPSTALARALGHVAAVPRQQRDPLEVAVAAPLPVLQAVALQHLHERELVLDRHPGLQRPGDVSEVEVGGRVAGVPGDQATLFHELGDRFHGRLGPPCLLLEQALSPTHRTKCAGKRADRLSGSSCTGCAGYSATPARGIERRR